MKITIIILALLLSGCAGSSLGCLNPWTVLSDCGGKHGIWP